MIPIAFIGGLIHAVWGFFFGLAHAFWGFFVGAVHGVWGFFVGVIMFVFSIPMFIIHHICCFPGKVETGSGNTAVGFADGSLQIDDTRNEHIEAQYLDISKL
eukprot:CAMPEP_0194317444 /NCGR_PEP_ID=MMETSP0171-20130528/14189_1 /TAXON_ID=218684 /ORGANISM="Corethron pennatum, Strain L29A3" /LENGTH=101 /DNA_ID=CAMNT_0039074031 /DNA_START=105 /DNA_END=410 /DNA_ORIENTATION=-